MRDLALLMAINEGR